MNNSRITLENQPIALDSQVDRTPWLRNREGELVKIIEAIRMIEKSEEWETLKVHIFIGLVETLDRRLKQEAEKDELNMPEIHRLQGQLIWAKKYSDFHQLAEFFKVELIGIRNQLKNNGK